MGKHILIYIGLAMLFMDTGGCSTRTLYDQLQREQCRKESADVAGCMSDKPRYDEYQQQRNEVVK
ncbi:MAG: hypothetical protein OEY00_11685 [Gammaproteobacteria bacterium]|nr:hypothetical protein [Gammaproteobacteria bacterium]